MSTSEPGGEYQGSCLLGSYSIAGRRQEGEAVGESEGMKGGYVSGRGGAGQHLGKEIRAEPYVGEVGRGGPRPREMEGDRVLRDYRLSLSEAGEGRPAQISTPSSVLWKLGSLTQASLSKQLSLSRGCLPTCP